MQAPHESIFTATAVYDEWATLKEGPAWIIQTVEGTPVYLFRRGGFTHKVYRFEEDAKSINKYTPTLVLANRSDNLTIGESSKKKGKLSEPHKLPAEYRIVDQPIKHYCETNQTVFQNFGTKAEADWNYPESEWSIGTENDELGTLRFNAKNKGQPLSERGPPAIKIKKHFPGDEIKNALVMFFVIYWLEGWNEKTLG
jgi:hypothetical protein